MDQETKSRTESQRSKILNALRIKGLDGVTNLILSSIALRYNARLQELYQQGYVIDVKEQPNGITMYKLISEPDVPKKKPEDALSLLIKEIDNTYDGVVNSGELVKMLEDNDFTIRRKIGSFNK